MKKIPRKLMVLRKDGYRYMSQTEPEYRFDGFYTRRELRFYMESERLLELDKEDFVIAEIRTKTFLKNL